MSKATETTLPDFELDYLMDRDKQIERINRLLIQLASGNFSYREKIIDSQDEFEAILTGINMLGEELESSTVSRDYLNSIYRGVVDMMIVADNNSIIRQVNNSVIESLGYTERELIGQPISILFSEDFSGKPLEKLHRDLILHNTAYNVEEEFITYEGERIPVSCSCSAIFNNEENRSGFLCVAKDISNLKQAERDLKVINEELKTFVYKASHDLKGPLASIIGLTNIAEMDINSASQEEVKEVALNYIGLINESARMLDEILLNLIDVTYLKQTQLNLEAIDFQVLLDRIFNSLLHVKGYSDVTVKLDIEENIQYKGDLKLLKSILQNLIENALKYRDVKKDNSWVHIEILGEPDHVHIGVSDNGQGIPKESLEKIFDMFYRASETSSGSGLGLYIVKNAVEKLKGKIEVYATDSGTAFKVKLPKLK